MKQCKTCETWKKEEEYGTFQQRGKTYRRGQCNSCRSERERTNRIEKGDEVRARDNAGYHRAKEADSEGLAKTLRNFHLKKKYNMTLDEFEDRAEAVDYKCEICNGEERRHKHLVVDHNHDTGEVRGLLCSTCNSGLGLFKDNPDVLASAIIYLKERGHYGRH
jgi:hypothetical protein